MTTDEQKKDNQVTRRGRPSSYSRAIAEAICDELASGKSLLQIARQPNRPSARTVFRWLDAHEDFRRMYARARELQAEHYAAEIIELADNERMTRERLKDASEDKEIIREIIRDNYHRTRLQIDARKWLVSKLLPRVYGERLEVDATISKVILPENPQALALVEGGSLDQAPEFDDEDDAE